MNLEEILLEKRSAILSRWRKTALQAYAPDTVKFLKSQKDVFANPVGGDLYEGTENLLFGLARGVEFSEMRPALDRIVRIRALQKMPPSEALGFILSLKSIIRETLGGRIEDEGLSGDVKVLEDRIDELALLAFDSYMACYSDLAEIRVRDEKRRLHMLLKRAGLLVDTPGGETDLPDLRDGGLETNQ